MGCAFSGKIRRSSRGVRLWSECWQGVCGPGWRYAVKFTLSASPEERVLEFNNPKRSRTIKIAVPSPTSPKKLGLGGDDRRLGIGFTDLRITPQE